MPIIIKLNFHCIFNCFMAKYLISLYNVAILPPAFWILGLLIARRMNFTKITLEYKWSETRNAADTLVTLTNTRMLLIPLLYLRNMSSDVIIHGRSRCCKVRWQCTQPRHPEAEPARQGTNAVAADTDLRAWRTYSTGSGNVDFRTIYQLFWKLNLLRKWCRDNVFWHRKESNLAAVL